MLQKWRLENVACILAYIKNPDGLNATIAMSLSTKTSTAIISLADQVRGIALEGLKYAKDPYDKARYESLLEIAATQFASILDLNVETLKEDFKKELGCVTPKLGTDAAVLNDKGQLLVLNRADQTGWCLPCGWVDIGENPASAAVREVREETGLGVEALGCISISTKGPGQSQNIQHQVNTIIAMKLISSPDDIKLSHEHTDYRWIDEGAELQWHPGHDRQADRIFSFLKSGRQPLLPIE